jgi:hypothetical protein
VATVSKEGFLSLPPGRPVRTYPARYVLGYRYGDVAGVLPLPGAPKPGTTVSRHGGERGRALVARSLGWNLEGFAPLMPDPGDVETMVNGAVKRFARSVPQLDRG